MTTHEGNAESRRMAAYSVDVSDVPADATVFPGTSVPVEYLFRCWAPSGKGAGTTFPSSVNDIVWEDCLHSTTLVCRQGSCSTISRAETNLMRFLENYPNAEREHVIRTLGLASDLIELVAYENADWVTHAGENTAGIDYGDFR